MSQHAQFDFDFIVIGSGFGGSVSAHRLAEKGYKVAVMEMGRRWTPDSLPHSSWSIHRWLWRPKLGLRGFFNMRFFRHVDHIPWLCRGRRIDYLRLYSAHPAGKSLGDGLVDGWPIGKLKCPGTMRPPHYAGRHR